MTNAIVTLKDVDLTLTSRAGPVDILKHVSLELPRGQSVAITGPSGSGKTSLLMVIAGLERASSGRVDVLGSDIGAMTEDELAVFRGANIGIVFQSFHLVPTMTALENAALPLELSGAENAVALSKALLDDVGLTPRLSHFPAELSGGEQQRVAIARALSRRPALILADEPTGNLDGKTGAQIADMLFGLRDKSGATLVLVTHDEKLAARADTVVRMADGKIVSGGGAQRPLTKTAAAE